MPAKKLSPFDEIAPQYCVNARIRRLHRTIDGAYQQMMRPYSLRGSMLSILFIVGKRQNTNQKTLSTMLVLDESTISRDLKKLIERGLISYSVGSDNRNKELELTSNGVLLVNEIAPQWNRLHQLFENVLGEEHNKMIDEITERIKTGVEQLKY